MPYLRERYDDVGQKIYKGNTTRVVNTPVADKNISVADKRIAKFSQQRDMDDMTYKGAKITAPGTNQAIAKAKGNINRAYSKQDKIDQRQGAGQSYITKGKPVKFQSSDKVQLNMSEGIQKVDVAQLEKFADRLFGKVGIDVEFTRHFMDRVNDIRNQKPITMSELTRLFKQEYKRWGKPIAQMGPDSQAVMKDLQTDINLPFVLKWDDENNELDLIAKTVMRKADFKTPNKEFPVEGKFSEMSKRLDKKEFPNEPNFPSYVDIMKSKPQSKEPVPDIAPAQIEPDGRVRGLYPDPQNAKQRASNIFYRAGRGLSRLSKGDPDYDPYDQRDAEVNKHSLPMSPYVDGSQRNMPQGTQSSIYKPMTDRDAAKMRAEIGAEFGLTGDQVMYYSNKDAPLPSQVDPKLIPKGTKMPTDAQVQAYRKARPPVFSWDSDAYARYNDLRSSEFNENVPNTNKPGTMGHMINWAGKNAPDKPKSNVTVARRKQPEPLNWWQKTLQRGRDLFDDEQLDLKKKFKITDELKQLDSIFKRGKHEIRIVGGAVRDLALGKAPKDIDLATDATPQEMQRMFDSAGVKHIPTGIEHGTITAVLNGDPYEITTLRADVETDGRRAEVEFVRSWEEDAKRRDLTYNAMSMDFDGNLYDYHGGMGDLQDKVTKFVGDPEERIKEDYLRTLRYFRFQGRLDTPTFDRATMQAIANNTDGLKQLSVERVWMEMGKILGGGNIQQILNAMQKAGVLDAIGLNYTPNNELMDGGDPIINLARITDDESIGLRWKMSNEEKGKLGFLIAEKGKTHSKDWYTDMMVDGFDRTQLDALARYNNQDDIIQHIKTFKAPEFPVDGNDLIKIGHERGPKIGQTLQALRNQWKQGNFSASKDELLKTMNEAVIPMLYHATYKPFLDSIMKNGLGGSGAQTQWEDSKPGYVYLAKDPEVAISHAEANDEVPDEYIDNIVVLSIDASQLDSDNLEDDLNVIDDDSTLAYKGIIPTNAFTVSINEDQEFNELDYVLKKEVKPSEAVMLTKLGKFHDGVDELEQFVPERKGKQYALHPDNWKGTYYSLTNRDTKKIAYYRPKIVTPPAGSIVADMYIANQFYRTNDEDEKKKLAQAYKDSMVEYGADISHIKFPEILMPGVNEKLQEDTSIPKYLYKWVDMPQFQKYIDAKKLPLKRGYAHYIESIDDFVKGNSFTDEQHISSWEGNTLIRIDSSTINNKIYPIAGNRTYLQTMHMKNPSVYDDAYLYEPEEIDEYWIAGPVDLSSVEIVKGINEEGPFGVLARKAGHVVFKSQYEKAAKFLHNILQRKYKETGGKLRHTLGYYAQMIASQTGMKLNWRELEQEYRSMYGNAMFENLQEDTKMPTVSLKDLYHVGTLDASKKGDFSYEGAGLSVTTEPDAWRRIARGQVAGDTHSVAKANNNFLDSHKLTSQHNEQIKQWAIDNGFLEQQETVTVSWYDDEMDDTLSQTFNSMADAEAEHGEYMDDYDVDVDKGGVVPTAKLKKATGQSRIEATGVLEYVLPLYAESLGLDGVWWADDLDVNKLSAPRGVIVPGKVDSFKFNRMNENFADGKKKGKSRPGRVKRAGASCKGSVTSLRKKAKNSSGEKAKMYHWCANMKSGKNKSK